jgi:Patatin-like phospholipase
MAESGRSAIATAAGDPDFIPPVLPPALSKASGDGQMDPRSATIRNLEWRSYLRQRRHQDRAEAPEDLTGIALSGGGIRSATFALGVLQALARHDLLRRFDYLSTVSGGGYIGTSLTWLTSRLVTDQALADRTPLPPAGFGVGPSADGKAPAPFPYGTDDPRTAREPDQANPEGAMLRYLRQHGLYLTPGKGITLTSVIVVLLRGIILNLLVWIPIVATLMWLLISASQHWAPIAELRWLPAAAADLVRDISPPLQWPEADAPPEAPPPIKLPAFGLMLAAAAVLFALCVLAFVGYSLATYAGHKSDGSWLWWLSGTKYGWRRRFERWMRIPFWLIGVLLLLASVPFVVGQLHGWLLGSSFSLIGLASGLMAFLQTAQKPKSRAEKQASWAIPSSWIASFGAGFLLYGVLLLSYAFGWWAAAGQPVLGVAPGWGLLAALILAIGTGLAVDLNLITVHRFYRDRLMEAFLPDVDKALRNETAPAQRADAAALSSMCDPSRATAPYHIINTNLVLTESDERTYRLRGGDSFILSPLYCGSNATGWQPTDRFVGNELTLPTAMAISGAAANPWTGSGGVGLTRNPLVGMLMALMNLRLGFWLPNPNEESRGRWRRSCTQSFRANHFDPGLKEVLGLNLRETSPVCLLSDGGHFENLGLYELIRRRVRLIVACDGTADPDYAFSDLQNVMARIWADFGARIEFDQAALKPFMPSIEAGYPRDARVSQRAYAIAEITYADDSKGRLLYLTTTLIEGLRLRLMGYKGANWDFPDQSTGDQFFDETQFEAYRELGYVIADLAVRENQLEELLPPESYPQAAE